VTLPNLYVLDANAFIEPAKGYYAFDIVPSYWDQLAANGASGRICTIDRVAAEILSPADLKTWIDGPFKPCIRQSNTQDTLAKYAALMTWAQAQPFSAPAKAEFATVADAWLVAYAAAVGATVVTHETFDANCRRRVKIPNACQTLGVPTINTFEMLRALGIRLGV
jgi:hypothetical protein